MGFSNLIIEFDYISNPLVLKRLPPQQINTEPISSKMINAVNQLFMLLLIPRECGEIRKSNFQLLTVAAGGEQSSCYLVELLEQYVVVFEEPRTLPPSRGPLDHKILLEFRVNLMNVRPYRYPLKQRDIIERLVEEMLSQGIIQERRSPSASPFVLVGKKD